MKVGDTFLVGVNYFNKQEEHIRSEQVFGKVTSILEDTIYLLCQESNEERSFPLIEDAIEEGGGGAYQFYDDAIPVMNPDFVGTYSVTLNEQHV